MFLYFQFDILKINISLYKSQINAVTELVIESLKKGEFYF